MVRLTSTSSLGAGSVAFVIFVGGSSATTTTYSGTLALMLFFLPRFSLIISVNMFFIMAEVLPTASVIFAAYACLFRFYRFMSIIHCVHQSLIFAAS
jgi:hypothetical protein